MKKNTSYVALAVAGSLSVSVIAAPASAQSPSSSSLSSASELQHLSSLSNVASSELGLPVLGSSGKGSSSPSGSSGSSRSDKRVTVDDANWADSISDGLTVTKLGDLLGRGKSDPLQVFSGDLGIMTKLSPGEEFAIIFGDSFRGHRLGEGEWLSPVGAVARKDENGQIEIVRPLNRGSQAYQLIRYEHNDRGLTLIPSDIININGTLYMQGIWNEGIGNVLYSEIFKSSDNGRTWKSVGRTKSSYMSGMGNLITWEQGPDGYIYVMSSQFNRNDPVYLSRFRVEDMDDRSKWQLFDPATGQWGKEAAPILNDKMQAGEMSLRYIQGHWVLAMFNEETMAIEVRISKEIARDWDEITPANVVIAGKGGWSAAQTPSNFTQLYGGYIVPGSTLDNLDLVVSQWNTSNNSRYNSTQFNVKGLDEFFGIDVNAPQAPPTQTRSLGDQDVLEVAETEIDPEFEKQLTQEMTIEESTDIDVLPLTEEPDSTTVQ
nr:DUF4185 domain-containing protein [Corynebacterium cystitidis]